METRPPSTPPQARSPLTQSLVTLAGTPDDHSGIDAQLVAIARLAAERIASVSYASITTYRDGAPTTVATSSDIAVAVDDAQYADQTGPCLDVIDVAAPVAVPDIAATMTWPGFRDTAHRLGLRTSLSIPLFAGRGTPIAALNLYGHDSAAMAGLTAAVLAAHAAYPSATTGTTAGTTMAGGPDHRDLDPGATELVDGLIGAYATGVLIQRAIGVIMADLHRTADAAYAVLRVRAAEAGLTLADTAAAVLAETERRSHHGGSDGDSPGRRDDDGAGTT